MGQACDADGGCGVDASAKKATRDGNHLTEVNGTGCSEFSNQAETDPMVDLRQRGSGNFANHVSCKLRIETQSALFHEVCSRAPR